MQYVMFDTGEFASNRFEDLCEFLEDSGKEVSKDHVSLVQASLVNWYCRWATDQQLDSGLLWNISESRMGGWSQWHEPLRFGRCLVKAGYCKPVDKVYPAALLKAPAGFVVIGALELSWDGVHRHRRDACDLVLYHTDPLKRSKRALAFNIDRKALPLGWLDLPPGDVLGERPPEKTRVDHVVNTGDARGVIGVAPFLRPSPPSDSGSGNKYGKRKNEIQRKSGKEKTWEMYEFIVRNKYDDPLSCLKAMDDSVGAVALWDLAIKRDRGFVCTMLANMTATRDAWSGITNARPAALANVSIRKHHRTLDEARISVTHPGTNGETGERKAC